MNKYKIRIEVDNTVNDHRDLYDGTFTVDDAEHLQAISERLGSVIALLMEQTADHEARHSRHIIGYSTDAVSNTEVPKDEDYD